MGGSKGSRTRKEVGMCQTPGKTRTTEMRPCRNKQTQVVFGEEKATSGPHAKGKEGGGTNMAAATRIWTGGKYPFRNYREPSFHKFEKKNDLLEHLHLERENQERGGGEG